LPKSSFPSLDFSKFSGVINDTFHNKKVVLFYKKGTVSVLDQSKISDSKDIGTITVFNRTLEEDELSFKKKNDFFIDL